MKILWISDGPVAPTGYGNVTRFVCSGLAAAGHHVSILGRPHGASPVEDVKINPGELVVRELGDPLSWQGCDWYVPPVQDGVPDNRREYIIELFHRVKPDVFVTLAEVGWLSRLPHRVLANFREAAGVPWLLYFPIDGDMGAGRLPPEWVEVLKTVDVPIAMSEYGRRVAESNGVTCAMIPHGTDTKLFRPPDDKVAAKSALGWQGSFVILCDARNHLRKLLPRVLEVFRRFADQKTDVKLRFHCDPQDPWAHTARYRYDIRSDVELLGLRHHVEFTPGVAALGRGIPLQELAGIYQAADVHLLGSFGEGFGLPTLQAAACGVVPMAGDHSASRELVLGSGEVVRVRELWRDEIGIEHGIIDIDDACDKLERIYYDRELLSSMSELARRFAEVFDWSHIVRQWSMLLEQKITTSASSASPIRPPALSRCSVGYPITVPVTLPPLRDDGSPQRVTGRIYLAGPRDLDVLRRLDRVFPGLTGWSSMELGPNLRRIPATGSEFSEWMATSTLALDIAGVDSVLPVRAAEMSVPCVARESDDQRLLWPELVVGADPLDRAALLARSVLADHAQAIDVCRSACLRLRDRTVTTQATAGKGADS